MKKSELLGLAVKGLMAASVVSMIASSPVLAADAKADGKVPCYGVNACKGQGSCSGKDHQCAGKNACKGQGWLKMSKEECTKKGGSLTAPEGAKK